MRAYINSETEVLIRNLVKKNKWRILSEDSQPDYVLLYSESQTIEFLNKIQQKWNRELADLTTLDKVIETICPKVETPKLEVPKIEFEIAGPACSFEQLPTGPYLKVYKDGGAKEIAIKVRMNGWEKDREDAGVFVTKNYEVPQNQGGTRDTFYPLQRKE